MLKDEVKITLRISHDKLDSEITSVIETAKAELIRLGISNTKVNNESDVLINQAIKTYCKWAFAKDEKEAELIFNSWSYQADNLRKTKSYRGDSNV